MASLSGRVLRVLPPVAPRRTEEYDQHLCAEAIRGDLAREHALQVGATVRALAVWDLAPVHAHPRRRLGLTVWLEGNYDKFSGMRGSPCRNLRPWPCIGR